MSVFLVLSLNQLDSNQVFMFKRSIGNTGYAGMQNPLLFRENCGTCLGDAKDTCEALRAAIDQAAS